MHAKPIVDIMLGLDSFPAPPAVSDRLCSLGYEALGEAGVPGRLYFGKRRPTAFNVQAVSFDSPLWKNNLLVRDFLPLTLPKRDVTPMKNNVPSKQATEGFLPTLRPKLQPWRCCLLLRNDASNSPNPY